MINNRGKTSANLLEDQDVTVVEMQTGRNVLRIEVPGANRSQRPVFLNNDPFNGTYRRNYAGDDKGTQEEVRRMFADQSLEPAGGRVSPNFEMVDIHLPSLT